MILVAYQNLIAFHFRAGKHKFNNQTKNRMTKERAITAIRQVRIGLKIARGAISRLNTDQGEIEVEEIEDIFKDVCNTLEQANRLQTILEIGEIAL